MYKPPYLQKYAGKSTRFTCPGCKTPYSFTRYLDSETLQPIHPTVGRCNREIKCGYHYTPRQYFCDLRNQLLHPSNYFLHGSLDQDQLNHHATNHNYQPTGPHHLDSYPDRHRLKTYREPTVPLFVPQPIQTKITPDYIPHKYLIRSLSVNSNFVLFLRNHFSDLQIVEAANNYLLGATRQKEVIFWQIDINGKVRTGKIMQYNPQTGRRVKHKSGAIKWVHHKLKKSNPSFSDFNLSQCYFGEHLLRLYPDKPIAIVEAEKTAVIASMIYHDYIWLAAGNLNGLNVEKSIVLRDKTVIFYPDAGCYDRWFRKAEQINQEHSLHLTISDFLERFSTPLQTHQGYDLADYVIEQFISNLAEKQGGLLCSYSISDKSNL